MSENIIGFADSQAYQRHHRDEDFWTPPPTAPAARPAAVIPMPQYRGRFQKGYDSRRHQFTQDERALGYENAKLAVDERYPDVRCQHGAALSHCLLRAKHPQFFIDRREQKRAA